MNPLGAPPLPRIGQRPKQRPNGRLSKRTAWNCYAFGTAGYQSDCINPGFEAGAAGGHVHWGNEPYSNTKRRYVGVVDGLPPGSSQRSYLRALVNAFNSASSGNRPYFLYYTAEQLGGGEWSTCNPSRVRQFLKVCSRAGQKGSYSTWTFDQASHFQYGTAVIGALAPSGGDPYTWYSVAHEFGHLLGFAHDTHCDSVMTYCGTFSNTYLEYGADQGTVFASLYDQHQDN